MSGKIDVASNSTVYSESGWPTSREEAVVGSVNVALEGVCTSSCRAAGEAGGVRGERVLGWPSLLLCPWQTAGAGWVRVGGRRRRRPVIFSLAHGVAGIICLALTSQTRAHAECGSGSSFQAEKREGCDNLSLSSKRKHSCFSLKKHPNNSLVYSSFCGKILKYTDKDRFFSPEPAAVNRSSRLLFLHPWWHPAPCHIYPPTWVVC